MDQGNSDRNKYGKLAEISKGELGETRRAGFGLPGGQDPVMNAATAVEGMNRDLNHHIPAYRNLWRITLADRTCHINRCVDPLDEKGLKSSFTGHYHRLPAAWITAQRVMGDMSPQLNLGRTDAIHVLDGDISISHIFAKQRAYRSRMGTHFGHYTQRDSVDYLTSDHGQWPRTAI